MQAQGTKTGNARRRLLAYCTLTCVSARINGEVDLEQFPIRFCAITLESEYLRVVILSETPPRFRLRRFC